MVIPLRELLWEVEIILKLYPDVLKTLLLNLIFSFFINVCFVYFYYSISPNYKLKDHFLEAFLMLSFTSFQVYESSVSSRYASLRQSISS